jgi:isoquinoline 1-oxidoreductase beta subunit
MKRRSLLTGGAALSVGFVAGCTLPVIPKRPAPTPEHARGWIRFEAGRYALRLPRIEMGQHIATGLKQIACEELGIEWSQLTWELPATDQLARVRATVGSDSMRDFALPLAQACATLREAVAAGRTAGDLQVRARPMGELRAFRHSGARWVGARVPLEHAGAIVRGEPLYAADMRRPGRVFGRVLRAPASPELASHPQALDEAAARAVPGFIALVRDERLQLGQAQGLGIVAAAPGALDRIEAALSIRWRSEPGFEPTEVEAALDVDACLARGGGRLAHRVHAEAVDGGTPWDVDLRLDIPAAPHGQMEPRAAVAEFDVNGVLTVWAGTQDAFYVRDVLVRRLGLDESRVRVQPCRVGGAFGARTLCTVELEAALLAQAAGRPVLVQWTRAQELRHGFHRPPSSHRVRVRLAGGRLQDWWHAFASSHILLTNAAAPAWLQRVADVIGDDGVARGASPAYRIPRRRVEFDLVRLPVLGGPWRGLGAGPNHLAIESTIDECARCAGSDPLRFRLAQIDEPRLARVLQRAAEAAGWRAGPVAAVSPVSPVSRVAPVSPVRRGRGIACGIYKQTSFAAVVAEVAVDDEGGVRLLRLVCAHDCGLVINPDQVRAQCEGNLVWGIGMVLTDRLPLANGSVAAGSFADAPIPRLTQVPPLEVHLVDDAGHAPSGAGETVIVAAAGAIANALRDATGVRPLRFPVMPATLRKSSG